MSIEGARKICDTNQLRSGGRGIKFSVFCGLNLLPAFVIRYNNRVYAYLNRCAHRMLELDWGNAEFFDRSGEYLICANHGALFEPQSGLCVNGPCYGASLNEISVQEKNSSIILVDKRYEIHPSADYW